MIFGKKFEPRKHLQDLRGQNHCKNVRLVKHLAIHLDLYGLKLSYLFLILKIIILEMS